MSRDEYGEVVDVQTANVGEWLTADAILGATTLFVTDASTFPEAPGSILLGSTVYAYTARDTVLNSLTLSSGLASAALTDDRVEIYPLAPVKRALVDFGVPGSEAVTAIVPHSMKDVLSDGMRAEGEREVVLVTERTTGELYVADLSAAPATVESQAISGDGYAPTSSPTPVVTGAIGALHVRWDGLVNADPVTYQVHMSTVDSFAPDSTTLVGTTAATAFTIRTTAAGLVLAYDTTYYVKLIAYDLDGAGPAGNQGSAQLVKINSPDVAAEFIYGNQIVANQIVGGEMSAEVVLSGKFKTAETGGRVEMDPSGITIYDAAGIPATDLGTDSTNVFRGDAEINNLTTLNLAMRGTNNEVAAGAELKLNSAAISYSNPSTAPTVVQDWQSVTFTKPGDSGFVSTDITSIQFLSGSWVCGYRKAGSSTYRVYQFDTSGVFVAELTDPITSSTALKTVMLSLAGNAFTVASNGTLFRHKLLGAGGSGTTITLPATTNEDNSERAIGIDGTNILIAEHNNTGSNDRLRVQAFNPTTLALVSTVESADNSSFGGPLAGILTGNFDFGAARYVTKRMAGSTADWRSVTTGSGGTLQTGEGFPPNAAVKSIAWDGSNFWSLGLDGKIYKYTNTVLNGDFRAGFTWYDSNATGGTHETMISPLNTFTLKRRARVTVTTPSIPAGGGTDDPNGIRIYLGPSGALKLQSTPSPGVISVIFNTITNTGASPPGSNNFGGGATPGKITNSSGTFAISGDGSIGGSAYDTGWVSTISLVAVAATNWAIDEAYARRIGKIVFLRIIVHWTNATALSVPNTAASVANTDVCTLVSTWRPAAGSPTQGGFQGPTDRMAAYSLNASGVIALFATSPFNVAQNDQISIGGSYCI
jgi:hypothetical protein